MARYAITPWRQQADLLTVRSQLFRLPEEAPDERRQAINRVMAWKLRGNLPHAVESTALLTDAQLHHGATDANSQFSIRAVYSAAFCRFVTGFCDIGRAREGRLEPSSMLDIAKQIDMPVEFVALRHEATHEELPSLPRLMKAVDLALQWLWKVYWSRLDEGPATDDAGVDVPAVKEEARRMLRAFRSGRREAFRGRKQKSPEHLQQVRDTSAACAAICAIDRVHVDAFTSTIVEEKLLLPTDRDLGSSMEGAFALWDPLLEELTASQRVYAGLTDALFRRLSDITLVASEDSAESEGIYLWLLHLLDYDSVAKARHSLDGTKGTMLKACALHPGFWTHKLAQHILSTGVEMQDVWEDLLAATTMPQQGDPQGDATAAAVGYANSLDAEMTESTPAEEVALYSSGWRRAATRPEVPIGVVA